MSLNSTPSGERLKIGFFGMRNAGKSSLVNALTGQSLSVVSDVEGTTTDPVKKSMELLPLGPVVIIDTPGIDDEGSLGNLRVKKTKEILLQTDIAVLVVDAAKGLRSFDNELISFFKESQTPYLIAYNKADLLESIEESNANEIYVSSSTRLNIETLKNALAKFKPKEKQKPIVDDLINEGDVVLLVTPIDEAAPKGRLILPQQITIRNILDNNATCIVCKETDLENTLKFLSKKPSLVITDSQVFGFVSKALPYDIPLTSFSIVFARYKGDLEMLVKGAVKLKNLNDGDKVLISEGCTHHRQCNDIGTVKMPKWIKDFTQKDINFDFTSGGEFPQNLKQYSLVVHCGGCMLGEKEMKSRLAVCESNNVPVVNYGVAIALMHNILKRSLEPFGSIAESIE
ncbi:MAG: [FeFe] hydrogenase H-cluster maturation GTPase HydF [Acutalibacteraceae bacterium]